MHVAPPSAFLQKNLIRKVAAIYQWVLCYPRQDARSNQHQMIFLLENPKQKRSKPTGLASPPINA
ncbi:hypothetical protein D9X91_13530 [Falsibacillus albus]|uniref:Uncharacterized protein n=1 Tax=Falsibacillus albus TaxID=2478915 RepID=A0A3L7JV04_9BACI|nr:hypothetical protein D9X91_13530 [Falsibacillus albus]